MEKIMVLGRGSYGVVFLMRQCDQYYAVKSAKYTASYSLKLERQILSDFTACPNIIQCFGGYESVEEDRGHVFNVILEYASGGNLLDLMSKKYGGKIPEEDVKECVRMILEGLVHVHERGYVHSDLKPENILVFPDNAVACGDVIYTLKIADFGLAKRVGEKDFPHGFQGTPTFMSPESLNGEISGALDIWSLGCIMAELFTGRPAWDYLDEGLEYLKKRLLNGCEPEIPERMSYMGQDFLKRCFIRDPKQRWTATMLLNHPFLQPYPQHTFATDFALLSHPQITSTDWNLFQSLRPFELFPNEAPGGSFLDDRLYELFPNEAAGGSFLDDRQYELFPNEAAGGSILDDRLYELFPNKAAGRSFLDDLRYELFPNEAAGGSFLDDRLYELFPYELFSNEAAGGSFLDDRRYELFPNEAAGGSFLDDRRYELFPNEAAGGSFLDDGRYELFPNEAAGGSFLDDRRYELFPNEAAGGSFLDDLRLQATKMAFNQEVKLLNLFV